jgi:hypothetical protein
LDGVPMQEPPPVVKGSPKSPQCPAVSRYSAPELSVTPKPEVQPARGCQIRAPPHQGDQSFSRETCPRRGSSRQLRRLLERAPSAPTVLVSAGNGYRLTAPSSALDALQAESLIGEAARARDGGRVEKASGLLTDALTLWRGDSRPVPGWHKPPCGAHQAPRARCGASVRHLCRMFLWEAR